MAGAAGDQVVDAPSILHLKHDAAVSDHALKRKGEKELTTTEVQERKPRQAAAAAAAATA